MRFVTPVALAIALAVTSGAVAVPAMAAKKDAKGAAPKLNVSPDVIASLQVAQKAIEAKDFAAAKAALADADTKAKSNDDKYQIGAIRLNASIAGNDSALQAEALNQMLDSGLTPAAQVGQFNAVAAEGAYQAKNYDVAIQRAQAALQAGYKPESTNVSLAQAYFGKAGTGSAAAEPARGYTVQGLAALKAAADAMKAAGQPVPAQWYKIGVSRADAAKTNDVADWAKLAYEAEPSGENLRTLIRLFQRSNPNLSNRENLDVMRLMSVSGGLVLAPDFNEYAEAASKASSFGEVKKAIDAGRAKGVLNATSSADIYQSASAKITADKSSLSSAEADGRKAANGKIAAATADAYLGYGDYAKAADLFAVAIQKGGVDANEVNTRIGIAKAMAGDVAGAKAAFAAVTPSGSRKAIADLWISYLNTKA